MDKTVCDLTGCFVKGENLNQFIFLLLNGLLMGVGQQIDTAFGNNMGIDSVCILSSYTIITWITYSIYQIGSYAYRINVKHVKNCMFLQILAGILEAVVLFLFKGLIVHLYHLTEDQYFLFEQCLFVHAMSLPFLALGDFYYEYMVLNCKNKELISTQIVYYVLMIVSDTLVFLNGYNLDILIGCTFVSYVVYDLLCEVLLHLFSKKDKITVQFLKFYVRCGLELVIDKIFGKVATVTYTVLVSHLGTELYTIHCIGYSIGIFTENITNQLYDYQIICLLKVENLEEKYKKCVYLAKRLAVPVVFLCYGLGFIMLFIIHGEVHLGMLIFPVFLYLSQCMLIQPYENLRGFLTSAKQTNILKWAGFIGILVRIPIAILAYCRKNIYVFALACGIDFFVRGIYFWLCSRKLLLKNTCELQETERVKNIIRKNG